jgi:hypothetical protein
MRSRFAIKKRFWSGGRYTGRFLRKVKDITEKSLRRAVDEMDWIERPLMRSRRGNQMADARRRRCSLRRRRCASDRFRLRRTLGFS